MSLPISTAATQHSDFGNKFGRNVLPKIPVLALTALATINPILPRTQNDRSFPTGR